MTRLRAGSVKAGWTRVAFGDMVRQVKDRVDPVKAGLERYVAGEHMDTDDLKCLDDTLDGLTCALAAWLAWRNPCAWETIGDHAGYIIVPRER